MAAPSPRRLLDQALHLAKKEPKRPQQVSLRRAVSSAYYALFHLLVTEACCTLTSNVRLRLVLARAFAHDEMAATCRSFAAGTLPSVITAIYGQISLPADLKSIAEIFVDLQKARHDADYATHRRWTRAAALTEIEKVEEAHRAWQRIRPRRQQRSATPQPAGDDQEAVLVFLACLAFQRKLQGR